LDNCGFTDAGEFRVFVPPAAVVWEKKLTAPEKQMVYKSLQKVFAYWEEEMPRTMEPIPSEQPRMSIRFNSPVPKQISIEEAKAHKSSEEAIDVKKTVKISKTHVKDIYARI
jgi:hypothetical protein